VLKKVLAGERFEGRAFVVDAWYLTAYQPLKTPAGDVYGMLFVGVREDSLEAIRSAIANATIGKTGEVHVLGAKGMQRGVRIIAPEGAKDGERILDATDADGQRWVEALVEKAKALEPGAVARQALRLSGDGHPVERAMAFTYFAPWDWVIVAEQDRAEALAAGAEVARSLTRTALAGLALTLALLGAAAWYARREASAIASPVEALAEAAERVARGDLGVEIEQQGDDEIGRLAGAVRGTVAYVRDVADAARAMARGDLSAQLTPRSDEDELIRSFQSAQVELNRLIAATRGVGAAAVAGRLAERMDARRFHGAYREVVVGVNGALDALVAPLTMAAGHFDRIARGDIPDRIEADWKGDFAALGVSLNHCIDAMNLLFRDVQQLSDAARSGRLSVRADPAPHGGQFRAIVEGVNGTLDAVVAPLQGAAGLLDRLSRGDLPEPGGARWAGDFATIQASLERCVAAIRLLVADADDLARAAVEGRLAFRADPGRHQGDYREVVAGFDRTLDALQAPVDAARAVLERLAERDLTARSSGGFQGDHARLSTALDTTAEALQQALVQVAAAAGQVSSATGEIANSAQGVATGAAEQARALQETASSLVQMAGKTHLAGEAADQAGRLARAAGEAAQAGTGSVTRKSATMAEVRSAAEGTAAIIRDINDIAFQTNLLALNAAVEAARAGEAGRGFAVVADEVRSLALRSKQAAAKTESLIKESVSQAEAGATAGTEVASRFAEIAGAVEKVGEVIGRLRASAGEQEADIGGVREALERMEKVTQQNASTAEQTSGAVAELSGQAEELTVMVSAFRIDHG